METASQKWYSKQWLVIALCIFFFPVGIYGLWKNESFSKGVKITITIILGILVLFQIAQISQMPETYNQAAPTEEQNQAAPVEETTDTNTYLQPTDINVDETLIGKEVAVAGFYKHFGSWDYLYDEAGSPNFIQLDITKLSKDAKKDILQSCADGCSIKFKGIVSNQYGLTKLKVTEAIY